MSFNLKNCVFGLLAVLPLAVSCGPSLSGDGTGSASSGSTGSTFSRQTDYSIDLNIDFAGITDASAISPTEVLISWGDAMFIDDPASAAGMRYVIFRGLTHQAPLRDVGQIAITGQGELTFTDDFSDLENPPPLDNTTWYYSVVAIADESISNNVQVAIARTPSAYAPGTMSFDDDVLPLFTNIRNPSDATQNCLSCHSTGNAAGGMDLSTLEGILAGVGTPANPDSFIIPFLGDDSFSEFHARFIAGSIFDQDSAFFNHLPYISQPDGGGEAELVPWGSDVDSQVTDTPAGNDFTQIATGALHSVAVITDGSLASWGNDGDLQVTNTPVGNDFTQVAAGNMHSVALRSDGTLVSWGNDGSLQVTNTPVDNDFTQVAAGNTHSVALRSDGTLISWGDDGSLQVTNTPVGNDFAQVSAGGYHSVALRADSSLVSWGNDGDLQVTNTPVGNNFTQVSAGGYHSVALESYGIRDLALPIRNWAFEGALPELDSTPPVFEFADVNNAGLYYGKFIDFDTVRLYVPHASDPESIPVNGSRAGQIDYVVYAGETSSAIDWDHPIAMKSLTINEAGQSYVSIDFNWVDGTGQLISNDLVVVVRPMDAAGRSVDIDVLNYDDNDQSQLDLFRDRMRNMSSQEREILITQ
jgi:hypothetical protein